MSCRVLGYLASAMVLSACGNLSVAELGATPAVNNHTLTVVDHRTPEKKAARRDSNFSAIAYLGDADVNPPALAFLKSAIQKRAGAATSLSLEISEFRVIDFFPVRLRAGGQGYVGKAIMNGLVDSKTDFAFLEHLAVPEAENSVICLVAGKLNGQPVKAAAFSTYSESAMSVSIRNDPSFKRALISSVAAVAADLVSQLRVTQ